MHTFPPVPSHFQSQNLKNRDSIKMLKSIFLPFSSSPLHLQPKPKLKIMINLSSKSKFSTTDTKCPQPICKIAPPTSAYIHLPFCRKRCHYCDFPIIALGSASYSENTLSSDPRISNYISLIIEEIQRTISDTISPLETIFFGGGTPSLVPPNSIKSIMDMLRVKFGVSPYAEISIEMDPGTFDKEKMEEILELGVNRVSLGVQAFQEELLSACGRAHGLREVEEAIEIVGGGDGLKNWSLDLISSLPNQSEEMWRESLRMAIEAGPAHISVYDLQVEQGTRFAKLYTPGEFPLPTETKSADFYRIASETLTNAGYNHYEISSYAKTGYECKHNLTYWQNKQYYAFGLGSASYLNGVRFSRPRRLKEYVEYVTKLQNKELDTNTSNPDAKEMAMDVVMLSLRRSRGLDMNEFSDSFGELLAKSLCKAFMPYVKSGHVIALDDARRCLSLDEFETKLSNFDDDTMKNKIAFVRLSDPDGFLLSNELIAIAFRVISP